AFSEEIKGYRNELSDISGEGQGQREQLYATLYASHQQFATERLPQAQQTDMRVIGEWLRLQAQYGEPADIQTLAELVQFMAYVHVIKVREDCEGYNDRIRLMGRRLRDERRQLIERQKSDALPPGALLAAWSTQIDSFSALPPARNPFYLGLARRMGRVDPTLINDNVASQFLENMAELLEKEVYPSANELSAYLKENPGQAPDSLSFQRRFEREAGPGKAAAIFATAMQDVAHYEGLVRQRLDSMGIRTATATAIAAHVQAEARAYPADGAARRRFLDSLGGQVQQAYTLAEGLFDTMPARRISVEALHVYLEPYTEALSYISPALDGSREGILLINLHKAGELAPWTLAPALFEATFPGQHLQALLLRGNPEVAPLRKALPFDAWRQGWGLYAASLMDENLAYFSGDDWRQIGYWRFMLLNSARAAADAGLHTQGWTPEEAKVFLEQKTGVQDAWESLRLLASPGKAAAAWEGYHCFRVLKQEASTRLGTRFYLQDYHQFVLSKGPMPLYMLEIEQQNHLAKEMAK
ncbi:MAG: DUF885 family protein, partial [Bacteroidetes bacterium]